MPRAVQQPLAAAMPLTRLAAALQRLSEAELTRPASGRFVFGIRCVAAMGRRMWVSPRRVSDMSARAVTSTLLMGICLVPLLLPIAIADDGSWRDGRATFYGSMSGGNIDDGSCMYGPLPNSMVSTGRNIAALSDQDDDFAGSCGRCYEVMCNPSSFTDGYGQHIDRSSVCYDTSKSVTITITDSCPCNYPANEYSNRRWCCGDMYHMDLSEEAFSQLADISQGVIGIRYRVVDCPGGFVPSPRAASSDFPAGTRKRSRR